MKTFDRLLQEDIARYEGRHADLIYQAPALYRLLTRLLDDPLLPGRLRPLVIAAIAYFILPADIMSEELHGPYGYVDDMFLSALVADRVRRVVGSDDVLVNNWDGEAPIVLLIKDILARETELIGNHRQRILWYIGYEYLAGEEIA